MVLSIAATPAVADQPLAWLAPACGAPCQAVRAQLTPADASELTALPGQVAHTLSLSERAMLPLDNQAELVLRRIAQGKNDGNFDRVRPGKHLCTVYWFGFLENGSEKVGTHSCRIVRKNGVITVGKSTGDGFSATLLPYDGSLRAVVGRTFLPEQKERTYDRDKPANSGNENYGNKVGLAIADNGRLYLISINERGFTDPDTSFFEVLAID